MKRGTTWLFAVVMIWPATASSAQATSYAPFAPGVVTALAGIANDGSLPDGSSYQHAISANGRYVAFVSTASNLVPGDTNGVSDIFVRDTVGGATIRASVASDGTESNAASGNLIATYDRTVAISADGRYVAFESDATNLAPGDTNGVSDIFVRDTVAHTTVRASIASDGTQANAACAQVSISGDGRYVAFFSTATDLTSEPSQPGSGFYVRDLQAGTTVRGSVSSDGSPAPADFFGGISLNGRNVVFQTGATGVVPGDTNGGTDVFVHNLDTGLTTRVSVNSKGRQAVSSDPEWNGSREPAISATGRYVAFTSDADNLVPGDTDGDDDVFVRDVKTGTTRMVDVATSGLMGFEAGQPAISANGRYIAFTTTDYSLVPCSFRSGGIYLRDMNAGVTQRVDVAADGQSLGYYSGSSGPVVPWASLSGDGHVVAFQSDIQLAPQDTDNLFEIYVHDALAPAGRPDSLLGKATSPLVGEETCNGTGTGQTRKLHIPPGGSGEFRLVFENDSASPDRLTLHGGAGGAEFRVRYFLGTRDVTAAMTAGTQHTRVLLRGEAARYELRVHVNESASHGASRTILVTASSGNQPAISDSVRAIPNAR